MRGFGNRSLNTNLTPTIFGHHLDHDLFLCKPILRGLEIRENSPEAILGATEEMARRTAAVSQHSDSPLNDGFVRESRRLQEMIAGDPGLQSRFFDIYPHSFGWGKLAEAQVLDVPDFA